jgi:hypothetical protein
MTRTIFKKVPRKQLADLVKRAVDALSDSRNYDTFEVSIDTDGGESSIEVIKEIDNESSN